MSSFGFVLRIILGFLQAPLTAALTSYVLYVVYWFCGVSVIGPRDYPFQMAAGLAIGSLFVAAPVMVLGAVPLFVWMLRRGSLSLANTLRAGAVLGVSWFFILVVSIPLLNRANRSMATDAHRMWSAFNGLRFLGVVLFLAFVGMSAAASFWFVVVSGTQLDPKRQSG
jgi:hypothetical protein